MNLDAMHERHRGLTPSQAGGYQEAAAVCLSRHHSPPTPVTLSDNGGESSTLVSWTVPDDRMQDAWANRTDTTEAGAYGCVLAAVELLRSLVAVRRAEAGTGADYYIGPPGAGVNDLEDCIRLEVAGVDAGNARDLARLLSRKVEQARAGRSSLPAVAGVIGFATGVLMLRDVRETP